MNELITPSMITEDIEPPIVRVKDGNLVIETRSKGQPPYVFNIILEPEEALAFYNQIGETLSKMVIKA